MAMGPRLKNTVSVLCILVLCAHFGLIINYTHCFSKSDDSRLDKLSTLYVNPFFHQSWQMFVPVPKTNYALYVRTCRSGAWSSWENLFDAKVKRHQGNRLSGGELIALLYSSEIAHALDDAHTYKIFENEPDDINFKVLNHAIRNDLLFHQHRLFDSYELIIAVNGREARYSSYFRNLH